MRSITAGGLALALATGIGAAQASSPRGDASVLELRQYKIVQGKRDALIDLFEREFVESQEAVGATLVGQFRDLDDPDRFTWIRTFADMPAREKALTAFYSGPVWLAHRGEANPMLYDNDNVLLLRPAWSGGGFAAPHAERAVIGGKGASAGVVVATIYYLWKTPTEGFASFFHDHVAPRLAAAGLPVLAAYVPEEQPNNFPRLPVRQGEKLFVWFTRAPDRATVDRVGADLHHDPIWQREAEPGLLDAQERPAQILYLDPTERSALR